MHNEVNEECGAAAVVLKKPLECYPKGGAAYCMFIMLNEIQNRGQRTAGFYTFNQKRKKTLDGSKRVGLVTDLFRTKQPYGFDSMMKTYAGTASVGHVRYATSGKSKNEKDWLDESQPFYFRHGNPTKRFVFGWNGNIANHKELQSQLKELQGIAPETDVDTELIMYCIANEIETTSNGKKEVDYISILKNIHTKFDGGYSLVLMNGLGHVYAFRGPPGIMPLCYGENEEFFAVASESSALTKIGITEVHSLHPGEAITYKENKIEKSMVNNSELKACFFQHIYFARVTSVLDNIHIHKFRNTVGKELAKNEPLKDQLTSEHIVVPVPDTSIPIAKSLAKELGIEYVEALIKSETTNRTFIEKEEQRNLLLNTKLSIIPDVLEGKKVILVDDSVVRGSTANKIVRFVRDVGKAKEVHLRSACPPIRFPCYYGIDFPTLSELVAAGQNNNEKLEAHLAKRFLADSVKYLTYDGLLNVYEKIGFSKENLCTACLTSKYPTNAGKKQFEEAMKRELVLLASKEE